MDIYAQIARNIIEQQETIIGPIAIEQAKSVAGITLDWDKHEVTITGDEASAIDKLVEQYQLLFGKISVEVCKEAAAKLLFQIPEAEQPVTLK